MAGTTVLLRRLDSDEEPLAKRLCIAQNVFQSSQLPIQRKEEAVINWFCKVAGKYRKKKKRDSVVGSGDDVLKLWSSLQTCVSSPHMQRLGVSDIRPSAKANLVKAISKHLERDLLPADHIAVLECAVALLEASSFQRYFRTNIPLCFNFVSLMLGSMSHLNSEHITLCVRCVSTIQAISRQTILRNDLCLTFLNVVLLPLITLLKSQGSQPSPLTIEIYKCIQQVLFPKASSDLPNFLNAIFKETKKVADPTANLPISEDQHQIAFRLLEVLREAKNVLAEDLFVSLIGTVFRAFVASQKSNSGPLIFKMTVVLSYLVGFHVKNTKCKALYVKLSESVAKAEKDLSLLSLNTFHAMVVIMAQWKIPLNGETCGLSFLNWLQMAVESLFPCPSHLSVGSSFLELMSILIKLNPLIVEPNVKNILVSITAKPLAVEEESFYSTFVSNLVGMYMKLNRIPNFTSILLTSLHDGFKKQHESNTLIMNQHAWLPSTVMEQLTQFATTMPSTSSISTLTILLDQFSNFGIQPHLQSLEKEFSNSRFIDLFLQCVCELFCSFLSGVRLLEQCTIFPARQGYCAFLKLLTEHLRSFGHLLLKAKTSNPAMLSTFLKMSYHWAAEALLIQQYADVGREELLASVETCLNEGTKSISGGGALSYLHSYLTCDEWNIIYNMAAQSNDENCKELLLNLDLQLLSAIRMFDASQSSNAKEVAKRASELLVQKLCSAKTEKLNRSTVLDIILISPLLTISDLVTLSDSIAICLIGCKNENSVSTLTSLLVEERLVACGLICSTLTSLKRCLKVSKRKKDENRGKLWMISKSVMGSLNSEMIIRAEIQNQPSSNEELELIISSIANTVEKSLVDLNEIHLIKEEYDFSDVSAHLQLLRLLPLAYLSPSHQAVLFISLLGVALDCNSLPSSPSKVEILKQIFDHLLLGMCLYERGMRVSPNFAGHLDYGVLISGLAHFVTYHNVGRRLLELVLGHALRHEQTQGQVLDKVALLKKKGKTNEPGKENLLVGSMLMQNLCEKKLKNVRSTKIPESVEESTSDPVEVLKRARNKLAKTFETLIEGNLVNPQEALHAFALTLDFNIKFGKGIDSIVKHLHNFTSAAVSFLVSNELSEQKAAETLLLVVFRNRNKLNEAMPKSLLKDVWLILSSFVNPSEVLVTAVFESASQDEMSFIADDLLQKTGKHTTIVTHAPLEEKPISNAMQFWLVLLKCHNLPAANNEVCIKAVRTLFERLPHLNIQQKQLLEFLRAVLSSSKVAMDMEMIDQCLSILHGVILPQTVKEFIPIATQYSSVLSALLLHRSSHTLDCIPSFLQLLQYFVKQLANQSKQTSDLSRSDGAQLAGVAFGVEKLLFALTKPERKKSFQRVAAYFLADIMTIFETITLCSAVKVHFQNMSYALISIIDDHAVKFLLRTMSSASNEIFKTLLDSYKKFHRFSGKV
ncbi:Unhealthy ribosome biogenesis protein 2-like protein [Frankliniella fusca]|uniref:Unhealthy ribosome biogenesis protein 2-like protein n=1 Tax=Frankliniella fusca TaxID=407009 RepID=A0AAE1HJL1_9NEOP|nr:Unhealthy ribosome biogenesis protein 2-like protein [Frankliniella fusca]